MCVRVCAVEKKLAYLSTLSPAATQYTTAIDFLYVAQPPPYNRVAKPVS